MYEIECDILPAVVVHFVLGWLECSERISNVARNENAFKAKMVHNRCILNIK